MTSRGIGGFGAVAILFLTAGVISALGVTFAIPAPAHAAPSGSRTAGSCKHSAAKPATISTSKAKRAVLCLLNQRRRARELPKLRRQRQLDRAARRHSRHMVRNRCFAHVCPNEPDVLRRLTRAGYLANRGRRASWGYGENIAWGSGQVGSPAQMVDAWMRSDGHRKNILRRDFRQIGIGVVWRSPQRAGSLPAGTYTTDFGFRTR